MSEEKKIKVESVEEYLARGGQIQKVTFEDAWEREWQFGREFKNYRDKLIERENKIKFLKQINEEHDL